MTGLPFAKPARKLWILATLLVTVGCSANGLADLPLPAPGAGSDSYRLTAVFTNALNLAEHARVKLAGADIGHVESVTTRDFTAVTTLRIINGVRLPVGSTAELRSATPLGDVFVSIVSPSQRASSAPLLADGETIGLNQTTTAATVESVLSSAAILINGGAVHNLTNIVNGLGRAAGSDGEALGELVRKSNQLLGKLDARTGQLETAITQTTQLADRLDAKKDGVTELLRAAGPATKTMSSTTGQISDLVVLLGGAAGELKKFPSIAGADISGRSVVADANTIARSFNDMVLDPDARLAAVERIYAPFIKISAGSAFSGSGGIDRLVLGSIPDVGFGGDPGLRGPKRYDWNKFIGTMKYTLWRLQERIVGQGPPK
jgi:phospholipid/cholesterol/gamma-HCH transport system substrate-binding protein